MLYASSLTKQKELEITTKNDITVKNDSSCPYCGKVLSSRKVMRRHVTLRHLKNGRFQCPKCSRRFFQRNELDRHMPVHTNIKAYKCETCGKSFKQSAHLLRHRKTHTGEKPFACHFCEACFVSKDNLESHQSTHNQNKLFKCSACSLTFKHRNSVYAHVKRVHSATRTVICEVCDAGFRTEAQLKKHALSCHAGKGKHFQCIHCGKKYDSQKIYEIHLKEH